MGRNAWNLWSAGNEHFWNGVAQDSFGLMDLLKALDNRRYPRGERFKTLGLINEPGFRAATKADEFGLWLDEQTEPEPAGIDTKVYGKPSGVLGFRLFPNPDFDDKAALGRDEVGNAPGDGLGDCVIVIEHRDAGASLRANRPSPVAVNGHQSSL